MLSFWLKTPTFGLYRGVYIYRQPPELIANGSLHDMARQLWSAIICFCEVAIELPMGPCSHQFLRITQGMHVQSTLDPPVPGLRHSPTDAHVHCHTR